MADSVPVAIVTESLTFGWQQSAAVLQDCSITVPKGEFWMLLGTNGCGKSTLLQLIGGLLAPQKGNITVNGTIGIVFQNPDRQLVMPTVGADVAFGLASANLTPPAIRQRVESALAAVDLLHLIRRPIYALSGGQKQRVAIAGAIACKSDIILFDEPTALLDPDAQLELLDTVRKLVSESGLTALWVTHRLLELDYCDGAILLESGKPIAAGNPQEIRKLQIERLQANSVN
jgi:energy-coupling factor transport system ATP-binding protein